jgi:acyl-CoA synthetase (AMP-forming)/AMP-acid ligase II
MTIPQALGRAARAQRTEDAGFTFIEGFAATPGGWECPTELSILSFAQLEDKVRKIAAALLGLGITKGERLAVVLPSNADFVLVFLGAICAGAIPVALYPTQARSLP